MVLWQLGHQEINMYSESTKIAISKLKEAGHFVAIATGRSYAMAVEHMKELGFENMVSDGGMELQYIIN